MNYVEAPHQPEATTGPSLFLAGGITGCPDWQAVLVEQWKHLALTVFNPRRKDFPIYDPSAAEAQITWEHDWLRRVDAILFWFPCETLCPITLYELGAWTRSSKTLFLGAHPDYQRRLDVLIQTRLERLTETVSDNLDDLAGRVRAWAAKRGHSASCSE